MITAIDPGPEYSAYATLGDDGSVWDFAKLPSADVHPNRLPGDLVVEMVACYGMAVGAEVFDTCVWIGRYIERAQRPVARMTRLEVKVRLCRTAKANDANIRQALIDRYGGKATAIGTKKQPGPLFGMAGDCWAALAVAVAYADKLRETK